VGRYQKGKTNLDFTEARDNEWQWHQLGAICKSAPHSRQITMPAPHHSVFMPFLPLNQQRQSTEGSNKAIFTTQHFASVYNVVMFLNFYRPISQLQQFTGN